MNVLPKPRDPYLDSLKGFAILLVVLGHSLQSCIPDFDNNVVFRVIYSFHMPLFMFLCGIAAFLSSENKPILRTLKSNARRLVVPFLSWYFLVHYILLGDYKQFTFRDYALRLIRSTDFGLWFLWVLFLCYVVLCVYRPITNLSHRFIKARRVMAGDLLIAGAFALTGCALAFTLLHSGFLGLNGLQWFFPFFISGYLVTKYHGFFQAWRRKTQWTALILFPILVCAWQRTHNSDLIQHIGIYLHHPAVAGTIYRYVVAFLGIAATMMMVRKLRNSRIGLWLAWLGMATMDIYVCHLNVLSMTAGPGLSRIVITFLSGLGLSLLLAFGLLRRFRILGFVFLGRP